MTNLKLNKASLSTEQRNLKNYRKYLPSLELKRKKLLAERTLTNAQITTLQIEERNTTQGLKHSLPMVAGQSELLHKLISIEAIQAHEENIVGVKLPFVDEVSFTVKEYVFLNSPHWFESLIQAICALIKLRIQLETVLQRSELLAKAIQTVTQRKNLFEKILIPEAESHIRLIQIFLADNERSAVVRSKIAKRKRQLS